MNSPWLKNFRRIYTTFILGTALLNFGTQANNIEHGKLDFSRVKAKFSALVPKNLDGPRPPQEVVSARLKRGPRAEASGILCAHDWPWKRKLENLVLFAGSGKMASKNPKNSGTISIWSDDATDMLIESWSEETIQFALENSKTSKKTRGIQHATGK